MKKSNCEPISESDAYEHIDVPSRGSPSSFPFVEVGVPFGRWASDPASLLGSNTGSYYGFKGGRQVHKPVSFTNPVS